MFGPPDAAILHSCEWLDKSKSIYFCQSNVAYDVY
jgi:hypothetical protein